MIKKICILFMALMLNFGIMSAQVEPAKFFDNMSIGIKGGVTTPLNSFDKLSYEQVGVEIEKGITPWLGVAADGNFFIGNKEWNTHTVFDKVNVNGLVKFNLFNMLGKFDGARRTFEMSPFTGLGWGHYTAVDNDANFLVYKAGMDFDFNIGKSKAFAIRLQPAVVWDASNNFKLNSNRAEFEMNVGLVYHFKNHDGNRTFTLVEKGYSPAYVNELNVLINALRDANYAMEMENNALKQEIASIPQVEEIVTETVVVMPRTQFTVSSDRILPEVEGNIVEIANYMKSNPEKTFTLTGYASIEGTKQYNDALSMDRAKALRDKLVQYGVDGAKLLVKAAGPTEKFSDKDLYMNRVVIVEECR